MAVELMKKYVGIGMRNCRRFASRHPLLAFMIFVLIWIYRSFPTLFSLLVYASPVIASTSVLLGTLLFFGHANEPEIRKERKPHHHEIHNLKFGRVMGDTEIDWRGAKCEVREKVAVSNVNTNDDHHRVEVKHGSSIDKKMKQEARSEVGNSGDEKMVFVSRCAQFQPPETKNGEKVRRDSIGSSHSVKVAMLKGVDKFPHRIEDEKGWETGSELAESTSPTASMGYIIPMLDDIHPFIGPEVPHHVQMVNLSNYTASGRHSLDSGYYEHGHEGLDKEDDDEEEDHQKNCKSTATSEHERNQPLENLIARQKVLKNMRIMAEKNMENISQDISYNANPIPTVLKNHPNDSNENILGSAPSVVMPSKKPFDLSNDDPSKEKSDPVDSVTIQPKNQFIQRHESFDVGPSILGASRQGKHLGPYFVTEPVTPDAPNFSSMHREVDELSDHSKASSTPDTESVGSSNTEEDQPSGQADSTSIREGFYTHTVSSVHYEYGPSREADLTSVNNQGNYPKSGGSAHYEDGLSRESSLNSATYQRYHPESVRSDHYENNPSQEADLTSGKSRGYSLESVGSAHYEKNHSREADLTSEKYQVYHPESAHSALFEDNHSREAGLTSAQYQGNHPDPVRSAHNEDKPSPEAGLTSAQYKDYHPESAHSAHYEDNHSREAGLTSAQLKGNHPEPALPAHYEDNHSREAEGYHPESVPSAYYEDNRSREAGLTSAQNQGYHPESVRPGHYEDNHSQEAGLTSVKNHGYSPQSVGSVHFEDNRSRQADLSPVKSKGYYAESVGSSAYTEDDPSPEADSTSVKKGFYEHDPSREAYSTSIKEGNYAESVASVYTEDDPSGDADVNSVKDGYYASEASEYVSQSGSSDDDDTPKIRHFGKEHGKPDDVKTTGYQGKSKSESSSSPFSDVPEHVDDEEDEFCSAIMPLHSKPQKNLHPKNYGDQLTEILNDSQIQEQGKEATLNINSTSTAEDADSSDSGSDSDKMKEDAESTKSEHGQQSTTSNREGGRFPQRLSQVQQGFTSWFGWKS